MSEIYDEREIEKSRLLKAYSNNSEIVSEMMDKTFPNLKNEDMSKFYLKESAKLGYAEAQKTVGRDLVSRGDLEEGLPLLESYLSKNDDADILNWLAELYRPMNLYDFERKDVQKALSYLNKAASLGSAEAYGTLGLMHEFGLGIDENKDKANEFYLKALEFNENEPSALKGLARFYEKGLYGGTKAKAKLFYQRAEQYESED